MAKSSGLGQSLFIGGFDLSGDVGAVNNISCARKDLDVTALKDSAKARLQGTADGHLEYACFFNDAANQSHDAHKGLVTTDRVVLYGMGSAIGSVAAGLVVKQLNYDWSRNLDGSLEGTVETVGNGIALEFGVMLTASSDSFASASSNASVDNGASSASGAACYLEVVSLASGTVDVVVEDSANDSSWATLVAFTSVTAPPVAERLEVAGTVDRYVRVTTSNTFTTAVLACAIRRGEAVDTVAYV